MGREDNKIKIRRFLKTNDSIFGDLMLDEIFFCNTLENLARAIPTGVYKLEVTYSPKFKRDMPLLVVPNRVGIRIHAGNTFKDSDGCILVGDLDLSNRRLINSRSRFEDLMRYILKNRPKTIEIYE